MMEVTMDQLLAIVGKKEVELALLRAEKAQLVEAVGRGCQEPCCAPQAAPEAPQEG